MKNLLHTILLGALMLGCPAAVFAEELFDGPESEGAVPTLTIENKSVCVCGANGEVLNIYNLAGVKVASYRIDSAEKTIALNLPKGSYIFKIGSIARKVSIRG